MQFLVPIAALVLLSACASAAPNAPVVSASPNAPPVASSSRYAQMLATAGRDNAASQADVERAFGAPDIVRREGAGAALTYRLDTCALLLLFAADGRNVMRLREAHPSARQAGAATPSMEQCAAEAGARRS